MAILGGLMGGVYGMYTGLMIAPVLGYWLSVLYIEHRYGKSNYPLLLNDLKKNKKTRLFEFAVQPETILKVREQLALFLMENACRKQLIKRSLLVFEELFMQIVDLNPGKAVLAECSVEIRESILLITKDDGRILNLPDTEHSVNASSSRRLSELLESNSVRYVHSLALSHNHNAFEICE